MVFTRRKVLSGALTAVFLSLVSVPGYASDDFRIRLATWKPDKQKLVVKGDRDDGVAVTVVNAYDPAQVIKTDARVDRDVWRVARKNPTPIPCRVLATTSNGEVLELDVTNAPSNCAPTGVVQPQNEPPVADAGPAQTVALPVGQSTIAVTLDGSGSSDADGDVVGWTWSGNPKPSDVVSPTVMLSAGNYSFTLVVTDNDGDNSAPHSLSVTVNPPVNGGDPHASITAYDGPSTCVACHKTEAEAMHGSVHYQQSGPTDYAPNIPGPAGERWNGAPGDGFSGINTYCGAHETSPRFTCAGCHVGNGRFPTSPEEYAGLDQAAQRKELGNIDCMMCHQEQYKRFPDPAGGFETLWIVAEDDEGNPDPTTLIESTGLSGIPKVDPVTQDFDFVPADPTNLALTGIPGALMEISAVEAAQTVHATTRKSCLNCHAGAGGGDGTKRGDMSTALIDPDPHTDYHMSSAGAGLVCADCHAADDHRVIGRGVDLRPNDVKERLTCQSCHEDRPHGDYDSRDGRARDTHAGRVACQSCHIPTFAKGVATEVARDWEDPHFSAKACNGRGGWLPREDKASDLIPSYQWFDGTSDVYYLSEKLAAVPRIPLSGTESSALGLPPGSEAYVLGMPIGDVASDGAKLHPMKEHLGKVARHESTDTLVAHSTFEFFRTGDFDHAVKSGLAQTEGMAVDDPYEIVGVHTYQSINHGVEPEDDALACGSCHGSLSGGPVRMNLQGELGYELKGPRSQVCTQCHDNEGSMSFSKLHDKHVRDERKDCSTCHNFSRPDRGLSTELSD